MLRSTRPGSLARLKLWILAIALSITACGGMVPGTPSTVDAGPPMLTDADIDRATHATAGNVLEVVGVDTGTPSDDDSTELPFDEPSTAVSAQALPPGASGVVAYVRHDPDAALPWRLVRVDAATQNSANIYEGLREIQSAAVSLDGDTLVFAMRHEAGSHFEIYRFVVSIGAVERLTTTSADNLDVSLAASGATVAWSGVAPNGKRTVFVRRYSGSSFDEKLLATSVDQIQPSLSGDGRYVAFIRPGSRYYVYLFDFGTETYVRVTSRSSEMSHPSVSDGAQKVAWYVPGSRIVRLEYMASGGTITVVKHWAAIEHPFLTSDGEYVVFGRQDAGSLDVFTWSEDTTEIFPLTSSADPVNHRAMSWQVGALSSYGLTVTRTGAGTVSSDPAGIDCGATCTASFAAGTSVTLHAVAATGWSFFGWTGACSGTSACAVSMDGARSVGAAFEEVVVAPGLAVVPASSNCGGISLNAECTIEIALQDASASYEGLEFRFTSSNFTLVRANAVLTSTAGDCLAQSGPNKVIVVCSEPFVGSGAVVDLTVRRTATSATTVSITDAFLAPDSGVPLVPVAGGSLAIVGSS